METLRFIYLSIAKTVRKNVYCFSSGFAKRQLTAHWTESYPYTLIESIPEA